MGLNAGGDTVVFILDKNGHDDGPSGSPILLASVALSDALRSNAKQLGLTEAETLLGQTLEEEKKADALLTEVANQGLHAASKTQAQSAAGKAKAA